MAWALAVILVLGVGLPFAAWQLSRHLESRRRPSEGLGPATDQVDKWLIEQHHLHAVQRWQVRRAVTYGLAVRDPALRLATRDLAGCVLHGDLKLGRGRRIASYVTFANGVEVIAVAFFAWFSTGNAAFVVIIPLGAWWLFRAVLAMKILQRGPTRASQLNV
jgi:hypothetical protein